MPSADWAWVNEGMANRQNLMNPIIPLGLSPVIEIYMG